MLPRHQNFLARVLAGVSPLLIVMAVPPIAAARTQTELLSNPGFEGPYSAYSGIPSMQVSSGWIPWYSTIPAAGVDPSLLHRPDYHNATAPYTYRVHSGCCAQQLSTFFSIHTAGVYQRVSLPSGSRVRFSIYGHAWSSQSDDPYVSVNTGKLTMKVGIDPYGGTNPLAASVVWSAPRESLDTYSLFQVEATAAASAVTVFTWSSPTWPVKHNDVYWDSASLVVVGVSSTATPTPAAGAELYTVQRGDYLLSISRKFGTTVDAILAVNRLANPNLIYPGMQIVIPGASSGSTGTGGTQAGSTGKATYYVARRGESLYGLAARFGTSVDELAALNGISTRASLQLGQLLRLPPGATKLPDRVMYTVRRGDSLYAIARRHQSSIYGLQAVNGIRGSNIEVGQMLVVP